MKGLGYFVVVLGLLLIVGAFAMDVSVSSGVGRVNNIGLMAERQNLIAIGGLMLIVGVILVVAGGRQKVLAVDVDSERACPVCAETIKCAAIKCKHCGSSVDSVSGGGNKISHAEVKPIDRETLKLWIARGVILSVFIGIIIFSH